MSMINPLLSRGAPRRTIWTAKRLAVSFTSVAALAGGGLALTSPLAGAQMVDSHRPGILWLDEQRVDVANEGWAHADSGHNAAVGNASTNTVAVDQAPAPNQVGAISVAATLSNTSGGAADIASGAATAAGNSSQTAVSQTYTAGTPQTPTDRLISEQSVMVSNSGHAEANTGDNTATGNASNNASVSSQATATGSTATASASNTSMGTATVSTGSASASGNVSSTSVTQG